ncbi:hypothetical protein [Vandammella animalimorsus]|uniref:hypothetical protein n=1 Tax=Vandammella animalimorsus TaxID=2029117 RepID=UPI001EEEFEAD|nr:hypothetical protein [Vandammella animalimorsus]
MNHGADLYCKLFVSGAADDEALSAAVNAALREDAGRAAAGADAVPMLDIARHLSVASRMMRPFTCQQAPCRLTTTPRPPHRKPRGLGTPR